MFSLLERWPTNIFLKSWEVETHGLCQQRKANQLKLFTLVLPCCSLPRSLRKRSSRRHRWTDTEESESLQNTPITSKSQETCEREPGEAPGSSYCCVSVTTEWSWWHCENDRECKAGDGRSLLLKCSPWLFMRLLVNLFSLGKCTWKCWLWQWFSKLRCWENLSWKSGEKIWMDERNGCCLCCPLLTLRCSRPQGYLGYWFILGKLPCPKVRPLCSDSPSSAPGCEEEHSEGKDQSLVSMEEQSQPALNQPSALLCDRAVEFIVLLSW